MSKAKESSPKRESNTTSILPPVKSAAEKDAEQTYSSHQKMASVVFIAYGICSICLAMILLFFSGIEYGGKRVYAPNVLLMLAGIALVLSFSFWKPAIPFLARPSFERFLTLAVCIALSFLIMVFAVSHYFFITNWDVATVFKNSLYIAYGETGSLSNSYFSAYPNNLLIVYLYVLLIRLQLLFSQHLSLETAYLGLVIFHCVLHQVTGVLLYRLTKKITGQTRAAVISFILYFLLVLLSPWVTVPYSDSLGLIFPVLILYAFFCWPAGKMLWLKWLAFALLTGIGYQIKPQTAIVSIAILLFILPRAIHLHNIQKQLKKTGLCAAGLALGATLSLLLSFHVQQALPFELDPEGSFGIPHYLMMGLNEETKGIYNESDVEFSSQFSTNSERTAETFRVIRERIDHMGWQGVLKQLVQKTLTNFNDGTFFWGGEGNFYSRVPERNDTLSQFLQNVYYNQGGQEGKYYGIWSNFSHTVWLTILFFGGIASLTARKREIGIIMLSLLGLAVFESVFEARARYLFMYAPLYILLASVGIMSAQEKSRLSFCRLKEKIAGKKPAQPTL